MANVNKIILNSKFWYNRFFFNKKHTLKMVELGQTIEMFVSRKVSFGEVSFALLLHLNGA